MIVTFPHMGYLDVVIETVFRCLGQEVIVPERPGKRSLEQGVRHSPELACLPFKMNLGDLLDGVRKGADTILCVVDDGPCRLGYYGTVHQAILRKLGYDVDLIPFEYLNPIAFVARFKQFGAGHSWQRILSAVRLGWNKLCALDAIHEALLGVRSQVQTRQEAEALANRFVAHLRDAYTFHAVRSVRREAEEAFNDLVTQDGEQVKVAILGEIYVVLEPSVNMNIERLLTDLDVYVERSLYLSHSVKTAMFMDPFSRHSKRRALQKARPYLQQNVGAECNQSVGKAIIHHAEGFDGIVHLLPFTCAPELVARTVLNKVAREKDLPLLSIVLDEHTGEAGLKTRLEAFVDLLKRRRGLF